MNPTNILIYFAQDAIKKGMPEISYKNSQTDLNPTGKEYRISFLQEDGKTFAIYSDGSYSYDGDIEGRLMRPHDRRWIKKLVRNGVVLEFAKMDWMEFESLHRRVVGGERTL